MLGWKLVSNDKVAWLLKSIWTQILCAHNAPELVSRILDWTIAAYCQQDSHLNIKENCTHDYAQDMEWHIWETPLFTPLQSKAGNLYKNQ